MTNKLGNGNNNRMIQFQKILKRIQLAGNVTGWKLNERQKAVNRKKILDDSKFESFRHDVCYPTDV